MSSKVLEAGIGFWVVAVLSISTISAFGSAIAGPSSQLESSAARSCLAEIAGLLHDLQGNSTVVVRFPTSFMTSELSLEGGVLFINWSSGSASLEVPTTKGAFVVPLSGAVAFRLSGGELEARALG